MIVPNFESFLAKHIRAVNVIITLTALLFAISLARNAIHITVYELVFALGVISASFAYTLVRDGKGYWFYVINSGKIFDPKEKQQQLIEKSIHPLWATCTQSPEYAALFGMLFASVLSSIAYLLLPSYVYIFIFIYCGLCLPWFSIQLSKHFAINFVRNRLLLMQQNQQDTPTKPSLSIKRILAIDLIFSILINLSLVLPLARKPAFSVQQGYTTPAFIIAFFILLFIVCAFMLFFASKSRRLSFVGELLMGSIQHNFTLSFKQDNSFFNRSRITRYSVYFIAVFFWSIVLCILFEKIVPIHNFVLIYFVGLAPLLLMYLAERYHMLRRDFFTAQDMQNRLKTLS